MTEKPEKGQIIKIGEEFFTVKSFKWGKSFKRGTSKWQARIRKSSKKEVIVTEVMES